MKLMKRTNIYKAANVTFNPETCEAFSYSWWCFVARIEGKVIFNNHRYSNTTAKHQHKVRALLRDLGIKIDIEAPFPRGIDRAKSLEALIIEGEENLCDLISLEVLKQQERNEKAKVRRLQKKLEAFLDHVVNFRDYDIKSKDQFGRVNQPRTVNQCVDPSSLERDVESALETFHKNGFGSIIFYV